MIRANSIRECVRGHTLQDTLQIMENGAAVYFAQEKKSLTEAKATRVLTTAYLYFEIERDRRSEISKAAGRRFDKPVQRTGPTPLRDLDLLFAAENFRADSL